MAKEKKEKKAKAASADGVVTVADLAEEFGVEPRVVRAFIRGLGFKAPAVENTEGKFGPRAKYEWDADSKELAQIRKAWKEKEEESA